MYQVNIALQVLPSSKSTSPYDIVDKAIEIIKNSGIKYLVCPFETVMEGDYDSIMAVIKTIQIECLKSGADSMLSNLKIQISASKNITIEDKIEKYQ